MSRQERAQLRIVSPGVSQCSLVMSVAACLYASSFIRESSCVAAAPRRPSGQPNGFGGLEHLDHVTQLLHQLVVISLHGLHPLLMSSRGLVLNSEQRDPLSRLEEQELHRDHGFLQEVYPLLQGRRCPHAGEICFDLQHGLECRIVHLDDLVQIGQLLFVRRVQLFFGHDLEPPFRANALDLTMGACDFRRARRLAGCGARARRAGGPSSRSSCERFDQRSQRRQLAVHARERGDGFIARALGGDDPLGQSSPAAGARASRPARPSVEPGAGPLAGAEGPPARLAATPTRRSVDVHGGESGRILAHVRLAWPRKDGS